ncbi:MAG TPA: hypothetical protein VGP70_04375 [Actinomadura sp.]|jgi:hypothetical protein|nr:hypothetical protein [Actinomadura sp.]
MAEDRETPARPRRIPGSAGGRPVSVPPGERLLVPRVRGEAAADPVVVLGTHLVATHPPEHSPAVILQKFAVMGLLATGCRSWAEPPVTEQPSGRSRLSYVCCTYKRPRLPAAARNGVFVLLVESAT